MNPGTGLAFVAIALVLGIVSEAIAWRLGLWLYNKPAVRYFNIVVTFGLIYGGLSAVLVGEGLAPQFLAGAALGLLNEELNDRYIRAWYFPGVSVPWLKGKTAVVVIGLLWGLVPPIVIGLHRLLF